MVLTLYSMVRSRQTEFHLFLTIVGDVYDHLLSVSTIMWKSGFSIRSMKMDSVCWEESLLLLVLLWHVLSRFGHQYLLWYCFLFGPIRLIIMHSYGYYWILARIGQCCLWFSLRCSPRSCHCSCAGWCNRCRSYICLQHRWDQFILIELTLELWMRSGAMGVGAPGGCLATVISILIWPP